MGYRFAAALRRRRLRALRTSAPAPTGSPASIPFEARPSMEAVGIDVVATAEAAGLELIELPGRRASALDRPAAHRLSARRRARPRRPAAEVRRRPVTPPPQRDAQQPQRGREHDHDGQGRPPAARSTRHEVDATGPCWCSAPGGSIARPPAGQLTLAHARSVLSRGAAVMPRAGGPASARRAPPAASACARRSSHPRLRPSTPNASREYARPALTPPAEGGGVNLRILLVDDNPDDV